MNTYKHKMGKNTIKFKVHHDGWGDVTGYTLGSMKVEKNTRPYGSGWHVFRGGEYMTYADTRNAAMNKAVNIYLDGVRLW